MFRVEDEYIRSFKKDINNKYLNVQHKTDTEGRHIQCNEKKNGKMYQQWDIVYVDQWKGEPTKGELNEDFGLYVEKPFHIISMLGSGRYLEKVYTTKIVMIKRRNNQAG